MIGFNEIKEVWVATKPGNVIVASGYEKTCYINRLHCSCGHCHEEIAEEYTSDVYLYGDGSISHENSMVFNDMSSMSSVDADELDFEYAFYTDIDVDDVCPSCAASVAGHEDDFVIHGLSAFSRTDLDGIWNRFIKVATNKDIAICCTSKAYCGPVGVAGHGEVEAYFQTDVWSYVNESGDRQVSERGFYNLANPYSDHDEYFVRNLNIEVFWVKDWYWDELDVDEQKKIAFMASCLGLPITLIHSRHSHTSF